MLLVRRMILGAGAVLAATLLLGACGGSGSTGSSTAKAAPSGTSGPPSAASSSSAPETNPAGDIPDNQVYVPFSPPGGRLSIKVPEGWARGQAGTATTFTDKLNSIRIQTRSMPAAPTIASATKG
jgi:hypothetical protein